MILQRVHFPAHPTYAYITWYTGTETFLFAFTLIPAMYFLTIALIKSIYVSIYGSTALCWTLAAFSFLIVYMVCRTTWTGDQPVARPLPTHRTPQTQNKRTQTSMPRVRFEPTMSVFEQAKRVHALDRAAAVVGSV
jgi:uncharacterized protein (DUF58 family)